MIEREDEYQLSFAVSQGRALYSFNVCDYYAIHTGWLQRGRGHGGIILAQQRRFSAGEQIRRLLRLVGSLPAENMLNRIEFLGRW